MVGLVLTFLTGPVGRWLLIAALIAASYGAAYMKGRAHGWDKREEAAAQEAAEQARLSARLAVAREGVTGKVVIQYRDRVRIVREKGEEITREIEKLVPIGSCDLPAGFRVLHDAAVTGSLPKSSVGTYATPVSAQDVAYTVTANYTTCHDTAERLIAFQRWAAEQEKLNPAKE